MRFIALCAGVLLASTAAYADSEGYLSSLMTCRPLGLISGLIDGRQL